MDFGFDDTQRSFAAAVRGHLADVFTATQLRQVWEDGSSYDHWVWKGLADLGVPGILIDSEHDGFDGEPVDLLLVLEELGASAVPEPVAETAVIAPLLLARFGDDATRRRLLPGIASGESVVALAHGTDDVLVPDGAAADLVVVVLDDAVHVVDAAAVTARPAKGSDPSRRLALCDIEISRETLLTADPRAVAFVDAVGATATAALLVGLSQHLLDVTREHVLARQQFGKVIGQFQALKHRLADVAVQTEAARSLVWHAGYRLRDDDEEELVSAAMMAKAAASRAAQLAGSAALQLHGGIGFTWEHDLHLWLQRGRAWERSFGDVEQHRARVGAMVLGQA